MIILTENGAYLFSNKKEGEAWLENNRIEVGRLYASICSSHVETWEEYKKSEEESRRVAFSVEYW